jgi:alpha-glucuronidase
MSWSRASTDRAVLYGTFALLRRIAVGDPVDNLDVKQNPYAPIRFLNHWDNLNGTIERGYAGKSIFWEKDRVSDDLNRMRDYGRLWLQWALTVAPSITSTPMPAS